MSLSTKSRTFTAFLLIAVIIAGAIYFAVNTAHPGGWIEIVIPAKADVGNIDIVVSGAVKNPGIYSPGDNNLLDELIGRAGGYAEDADISRLELRVPSSSEPVQSQKININTAEIWLLKALPGIGDTIAARIVEYRQSNGPFRQKEDLLKIRGISESTLARIKDLITITE